MTQSTGWKITGYFTPVESDYDEKPTKTITVKDVGQRTFRAKFLHDVETEGWGKTLKGDYIGFYDDAWHFSDRALDANGGELSSTSVAIDPSVVPFGTKITIPHLPPPLNKQTFVAVDIGAVQGEGTGVKGKHIDIYCGEGKQAQELTYKITSKNQKVFLHLNK